MPAGVETKVAINFHWIWYLMGWYFFNNSCALVTEISQNGLYIVLHVINTVIYGALLLAISCTILNLGTALFRQLGSVISGYISSRFHSLLLPLPKITNTSINGEKGKIISQTKMDLPSYLYMEVQIIWRRLGWLAQLNGHIQRVVASGSMSRWRSVASGVSQGSGAL